MSARDGNEFSLTHVNRFDVLAQQFQFFPLRRQSVKRRPSPNGREKGESMHNTVSFAIFLRISAHRLKPGQFG